MDLAEALGRAGLRATKQRLAVIEALEGRTEAVTAQDLHQEMRSSGGRPGLATIYRTLSSLAQADVVDTFSRDGEQAFKLCGGSHHHHLVCKRCGLVEEVTSDAIESWVDRVSKRRGFKVTGHSAEVYGFCSDCQRTPSEENRARRA